MIKVTHGLLAIMIGIGATSSVLHATEFNNRNNAGAVFVMTNDAGKNRSSHLSAAPMALSAIAPLTKRTVGAAEARLIHSNPRAHSRSVKIAHFFCCQRRQYSVSFFSVHKALLTFLNKAPSGGAQPSAVAEHGGLEPPDQRSSQRVRIETRESNMRRKHLQ
jgi:hypothetical protein